MRKAEGRGPLGRSGCRLENNIKIDVKYDERRCGLDARDRDRWRVPVNAVMNLRFA